MNKGLFCAVCKGFIDRGDVCIQSLNGWGHFNHEECHSDRFQGSINHEPKNERPVD